jgi:hypothetical protein
MTETSSEAVISGPMFDPVGGYPLVAGMAALLVLLLILGPVRSRTTPRRRAALSGLRVATIVLVILAMLRPSMLVPKVDDRPDSVLELIDRSRSMNKDDQEGSRTRWEIVEKWLGELPPIFDKMKPHLEPRIYGFDGTATRLDPTDGKFDFGGPPTGDETAIGRSLDHMLRPEAGKRLAGVFLITDGAQRTLDPNPMLPAVPVKQWLGDRGFPLFTIPVGKEQASGQTRDVALRNLLTTEPVFVKNPLTVEGNLSVHGYDNQQIEVQLLIETAPGSGKLQAVATKRIDGRRAGTELGERVVFDYIPTAPGEYKVALRAPPQLSELKITNNEITTFISVSAEGLNVLYIEGTPRVEQTFIRRSLDASPDIHVEFLEYDRPKAEGQPNLAGRFKPGAYDVYIFGDVDSSVFRHEDMEALVRTVNAGAGFIMLGGTHSFGAGGYGRTPLAALLPIRIDNLERQNYDEPIRSDLHLPGPMQLAPTQAGRTQSLLQLASDPAANTEAWSALPPLIGANRFAGVAEGSLVLATADGPEGAPLLVMRDFNRGRVLASAFDSTWRWRMRGFEAAHKRYWRRTILWLAHRDDTGENVWLRLPQRSFSPGAQLDFTTGATRADGTVIADAVFQATVTLPDGTPLRPSIRRRGEDTIGDLTLPAGPPGDYLLEVVAFDAARKELGRAQARFHVFAQDLELDNPNAYPGMLRTLADMTSAAGGRQIEFHEFADVLRALQEKSREKRSESPELESLWDRWELLVLFVALLTGEWFLRKKWGLV